MDAADRNIFTKVDFSELEPTEKAMEEKFVYEAQLNTLTLHIAYPYEVDLCRIKSAQDLLGWVHHLTIKTWMTREYIHRFIERVCAIKGWSIY